MKSTHFSIDKLLSFFEKGAVYDFFAEDIRFMTTTAIDGFSQKLPLAKKEIKHLFKEIIEKEYSREEYVKTVQDGLAAFMRLYREYEEVIENPHLKDKIIGFLAKEPLSKWPVVVRRLVEARRKRNKLENKK